MAKGNIGVTTENIFPVIKKFLYSDHEIFLREIVSNAVDATQKIKTLASVGEYKGELGDTTVRISINKDAKTLTISDCGIGLTMEEVDKYINQIAFSGAEEFLEKYKNDANAIIGHFGLGFYSAFMVSKEVEIKSLSYKEGAKPIHWQCDGSPEYDLEEGDKTSRGTDIILHIDEENEQFLEENKISELLNKYCKFLPIPIAFGKKKEWKDGKEVETSEDNIINNPTPAWTKNPADLKDEDYEKFYNELYPYSEPPLFHIHLNVDYPFNLTGILYFPKIKNNMELRRNKIQLYCNQVFVTDAVEGIVPEFLTLLHGVIDSPDIPLNVSRSYLQEDSNVKKISNHISKKVSDRLQELFKEDRNNFESKWDYLKLFIEYGMLSEEKFYERAEKFALLKNVDDKYFTFEEYKTLISENQTDKDGKLVYLYANNKESQFSYIEAAKNKGYDVLLMNGELDTPFINMLEQKFENASFVRVDSDIISNLIRKDEKNDKTITEEQEKALHTIFNSVAPKDDKMNFIFSFQNMGAENNPVVITQNEFMRRMKDMSAFQPGMSFYGQMPDSYTIVINTEHELIKRLITENEQANGTAIEPLAKELSDLKLKKSVVDSRTKDKKAEDISEEDKNEKASLEKQIKDTQDKIDTIYSEYGKKNDAVSQLIDIALLSNNMLKGEALNKFIKRSVKFI
ncbi:MAG: molecular chaperone HtpG [Paludibacteraceae bacterium]|nr:molecular chaperone HtpG [Paludibacteraceae bacterium]